MKTLLFCTAYADSEEKWKTRYETWYRHHKNSPLVAEKIILIDDCSPTKPSFLPSEDFVSLCPHIGYPRTSVYGGWYRSFGYACQYAISEGYEKIVHVESDAYLLSDRIFSFFNSVTSGWHSLWHHRNCSPYPESATQIICSDQFEKFLEFFSKPYEVYAGETIERLIPFTENHKNFIGDRYGEFKEPIPKNADFSCQTSQRMILDWLNEKALLQKL